ncbi:DUF3124 domain-containing protein [Aquimarina muelleri]|uniref:DUF3124 domain-containing protein n=1 Tax=Aquimarina muelleri TaxID=279356 RepID=A0A918N5Z1_9FLAO|nr:DUF3124 domain-containing protein [Aquimarina muelleri]MCX2764733.1 DUF3124 domain-containing protein [Aquimarina muelleri]GGX33436.1 hypothetical protein GCM10007384_37620 [Aquimarina muelleri]
MNPTHTSFLVLFLCIVLSSCIKRNPNKQIEQRILKENTIKNNIEFTYPIQKQVYVPIYSDIYNKTKDHRFQLTATLSIRNISPKDSLFLENVDYYDTQGNFVRAYIKKPIYLKPLESIEYVIEEKDTIGGSGANFLINWGAHREINPLFQGIMVGVLGQQGFAFTTEGTTVLNMDEF